MTTSMIMSTMNMITTMIMGMTTDMVIIITITAMVTSTRLPVSGAPSRLASR